MIQKALIRLKQELFQYSYIDYLRCAHKLIPAEVECSGFLSKVPVLNFPLDLIKLGLTYSLYNLRYDLVCEFGVYQGARTRFISNWIQKYTRYKKFFAFDSFEGLPTDWNEFGFKKGKFKTIVPPVNKNVNLVKGLFADTLPTWVETHKENVISLALIDCDLYSSTSLILKSIKPLLQKNSLLIFDEYYGFNNWENGEHKALVESGLEYSYLTRAKFGNQVLVLIK